MINNSDTQSALTPINIGVLGNSSCLRSKRSVVRIHSGVPTSSLHFIDLPSCSISSNNSKPPVYSPFSDGSDTQLTRTAPEACL